jgi:hypothetical protein
VLDVVGVDQPGARRRPTGSQAAARRGLRPTWRCSSSTGGNSAAGVPLASTTGRRPHSGMGPRR